MTIPKNYYYVCLFVALIYYLASANHSGFVVRSEIGKYKIVSSDIVTARNLLDCALTCMVNPPCVLFFFDEATKGCEINIQMVWDDVNSPGKWTCYERESRNIAVNKPASASTILFNSPDHLPSQAVDGSVVPEIWGLYCYHSDAETTPWLSVDLGTEFDIDFVLMYNRYDAFGERLHDVSVTVSSLASFSTYTQCGYYTGPGDEVQISSVVCQRNVNGRYIKVQIMGSTATEYLTICELEIFVM